MRVASPVLALAACAAVLFLAPSAVHARGGDPNGDVNALLRTLGGVLGGLGAVAFLAGWHIRSRRGGPTACTLGGCCSLKLPQAS